MAQVFDPRFNNLAITISYPIYGNLTGSRTLTLSIRNGEGAVWLDPGVTPTVGTITYGTLTLASETFPRFAPLSLTLTGADLCFLVRSGQVVSCCLVDGQETLLRLHCAGLWTAAYAHRLAWPTTPSTQDRLILTRANGAEIDGATGRPRESEIAIYLKKGVINGMPGIGRKLPNSNIVSNDRVVLARAVDGELQLQLHGARMEWDFADGALAAIRAYGSDGPIANLRVLNVADAGALVSVALADTVA